MSSVHSCFCTRKSQGQAALDWSPGEGGSGTPALLRAISLGHQMGRHNLEKVLGQRGKTHLTESTYISYWVGMLYHVIPQFWLQASFLLQANPPPLTSSQRNSCFIHRASEYCTHITKTAKGSQQKLHWKWLKCVDEIPLPHSSSWSD